MIELKERDDLLKHNNGSLRRLFVSVNYFLGSGRAHEPLIKGVNPEEMFESLDPLRLWLLVHKERILHAEGKGIISCCRAVL
jgi:hypothetical protein